MKKGIFNLIFVLIGAAIYLSVSILIKGGSDLHSSVIFILLSLSVLIISLKLIELDKPKK